MEDSTRGNDSFTGDFAFSVGIEKLLQRCICLQRT